MIDYGVEVAAIVARIEKREQDLSDRIRQIQEKANASIMMEVRQAEDELIPARFLLRTLEQLLSDNHTSKIAPSEHADKVEPAYKTRRQASSPTAEPGTSGGAKQLGVKTKQTAASIMLAMLKAVPSGATPKEIDENIVKKGFKPAAARKARYLAQKSGVVKLVDGVLLAL